MKAFPVERLLLSKGVYPHLVEYLLDLLFIHKSHMPENFLIFCIEEYLRGDEPYSVNPGKLSILINFDYSDDDSSLVLL